MNKILLFGSLVVLSGLGGCLTSSGTVYYTDEPFQYLAYAASKGALPVMVTGAASIEQRTKVEASAIKALKSQYPTLADAFQPAAAVPGQSNKVIVLVNASGYANATAVCLDPTQIPATSNPNVNSAGLVYCGVGPYSEAWIKLDASGNADMAEFDHDIAMLVHDGVPRFPFRDRDSQDGQVP